jgi:hypothetical protein
MSVMHSAPAHVMLIVAAGRTCCWCWPAGLCDTHLVLFYWLHFCNITLNTLPGLCLLLAIRTCVGPVSSSLKALKGMQAAGPPTGQLPYWPDRRMVVSPVCLLRSSQCCRSLEPCRQAHGSHVTGRCEPCDRTIM